MEQVAVFPFEVFAVIVAVPALLAVTTPDELTLATLLFDELHVTVLLLALVGFTVAFNVNIFPTIIVLLLAFNVTLVGKTVVVGVSNIITVLVVLKLAIIAINKLPFVI